MKQSLFLVLMIIAFHLDCFSQKNNQIELIKKSVTSFLHWYKVDQANPVDRDYKITKGGYPDTTTKRRIDKDGVERYLNNLRNSKLVSETFINNLRQHFYQVDVHLEENPIIKDLIPIIGLDYDIVLSNQEPELVLDYIDQGIFKKISIIHHKSIVEFYVPPYRITVVFALTKVGNKWKLDDISYD
ncbi:hypothetical protein ACSBL2_17245 [Pedobacter sp. AW31-3R]|uniref:hypothetical protein n=1 Tax=Pedobacter sp. AW31-3R TaxID=3445781 RepID=UPI003FA13E3A